MKKQTFDAWHRLSCGKPMRAAEARELARTFHEAVSPSGGPAIDHLFDEARLDCLIRMEAAFAEDPEWFVKSVLERLQTAPPAPSVPVEDVADPGSPIVDPASAWAPPLDRAERRPASRLRRSAGWLALAGVAALLLVGWLGRGLVGDVLVRATDRSASRSKPARRVAPPPTVQDAGTEAALPWSAEAARGPCTAAIDDLPGGNIVGARRIMTGTATVPENGHLWLLAHMKSLGDRQWWPQADGQVHPDGGGTWRALVVFGAPRDVHQLFEVMAIVVDAETHQRLLEWYRESDASGHYLPIPFPPSLRGCGAGKLTVTKSSY